MALPTLASLPQLITRLGGGDLSDSEEARGESLLEAASSLIRDEAGEEWVDEAGQLDDVPERVVQVCIEVAKRAMQNPDAVGQKAVGDLNKSYDRARVDGGESVYLTRAELRAVRRAAGMTSSVFRTATLVSPYSGDDAVSELFS